jgi:hypothetical protein
MGGGVWLTLRVPTTSTRAPASRRNASRLLQKRRRGERHVRGTCAAPLPQASSELHARRCRRRADETTVPRSKKQSPQRRAKQHQRRHHQPHARTCAALGAACCVAASTPNASGAQLAQQGLPALYSRQHRGQKAAAHSAANAAWGRGRQLQSCGSPACTRRSTARGVYVRPPPNARARAAQPPQRRAPTAGGPPGRPAPCWPPLGSRGATSASSQTRDPACRSRRRSAPAPVRHANGTRGVTAARAARRGGQVRRERKQVAPRVRLRACACAPHARARLHASVVGGVFHDHVACAARQRPLARALRVQHSGVQAKL